MFGIRLVCLSVLAVFPFPTIFMELLSRDNHQQSHVTTEQSTVERIVKLSQTVCSTINPVATVMLILQNMLN